MKEPRPETIARVLSSVGYLRRVGPRKRFGTRHTAVAALTITEIAKKTGLNQSRLKPIIRDLHDSQLIDVALQHTTFRRPIEKYGQPRLRFSTPKWLVKRPKLKIPKGLSFSQEFEYRIRNMYTTLPVPQRDIYLHFYRTELGQEWLDHYHEHPRASKKLREIRERHRISKLPKTKWDWIFEPENLFPHHPTSVRRNPSSSSSGPTYPTQA